MAKRIGTFQRKTRDKLSLHYKERGKISVSRYLHQFTGGDKVALKLAPGVQTGRFYPRFHGLMGTITGVTKGRCYEVVIHDGNKEKRLYVHPIHLLKQ